MLSCEACLDTSTLGTASQTAAESPPSNERPLHDAPVVALFIGFGRDGWPLVGMLGAQGMEVMRAQSAIALAAQPAGAYVVVSKGSYASDPLILGVVQYPGMTLGNGRPEDQPDASKATRCVIEASEEIVLRCGEASIRLTKNGRLVIQGSYVLNRSTGPVKIKGAVVDIN